jgi:hypothetical protein
MVVWMQNGKSISMDYPEKRVKASVVTAKPAIAGHLKTGQRN